MIPWRIVFSLGAITLAVFAFFGIRRLARIRVHSRREVVREVVAQFANDCLRPSPQRLEVLDVFWCPLGERYLFEA